MIYNSGVFICYRGFCIIYYIIFFVYVFVCQNVFQKNYNEILSNFIFGLVV